MAGRAIGLLALVLIGAGVTGRAPAAALGDDTADRAAFQQRIAVAEAGHWERLPFDQVVSQVAESFIGTPYQAKTLEEPGPEHLVADLTGLDCTTFVEVSLALARCVRLQERTFAGFQAELTRIRYRHGQLAGFPSRLHYFSDWIDDGVQKGTVADVTAAAGGVPDPLHLDFMSTHAQAYPALADPAVVTALQGIERQINARPHTYLPMAALAASGDGIHAGDILAITTAVPGLDVTHVGWAVRGADGQLHFLHAPNVGQRVRLNEAPLAVDFAQRTHNSGVMIARPLDPQAGPAIP